MDIAIIGLGACGVSVLRHLINNKDKLNYKKIYVFHDIDRQFTTGLPYQWDHDSLVLNVYPDFISLNEEDKNEFTNYLKNQGIDFDPYDFVPRKIFGQYLHAIYDSLDLTDVEVIYQEVVGIKVLGQDDYLIELANGQRVNVGSVQLTTGHLAYNDPYDLKGEENYFHNPYPVDQKLAEIEDTDQVAIIGAGLSAIDILMYLKKDWADRPVDMFSLEGFTKTVRGKNYQNDIQLSYVSAQALTHFADNLGRELTTDDLMGQFKKEVLHHGVDFDYFWYDRPEASVETISLDLEEMDQLNTLQTIIMAFKADLNPTWDRLNDEEKEKFLNEHNSQLSLYGAPIPASRAKKIVDFTKEGSLGIYGNTEDIYREPDQTYTVKTKDADHQGYDYIINATGQSLNVGKNLNNQTPLVKQMILSGLAEPHPFGGMKADYPTFSLIHPKLGQLDTFKVYGQLSSGIDPFNNSIAKLRRSTQMGVEALVDYLN